MYGTRLCTMVPEQMLYRVLRWQLGCMVSTFMKPLGKRTHLVQRQLVYSQHLAAHFHAHRTNTVRMKRKGLTISDMLKTGEVEAAHTDSIKVTK